MGQIQMVDLNRIKFEARVNPPPEEARKGSGFGRFLRAFGMIAGPVGYASSFFFPPAALIGAAAYGLGQFGSHKDASKARQQTPAATPVVFFPGMGGTQAGVPSAPTSQGVDPMDVIMHRQEATNEMVRIK